VTEPDQPYRIDWAAPARRALTRIPEKTATAAVEFIYGPLAGSPHRVGHPLRYELRGRHSARRGDHRIIYRIDDEQRRVVIEAIQHRADAYRPR
jgi:mRNA interferase RelE/StbE